MSPCLCFRCQKLMHMHQFLATDTMEILRRVWSPAFTRFWLSDCVRKMWGRLPACRLTGHPCPVIRAAGCRPNWQTRCLPHISGHALRRLFGRQPGCRLVTLLHAGIRETLQTPRKFSGARNLFRFTVLIGSHLGAEA